ncbi:MAG TPA: signal peptidase II [Candidatus Limnocylindria bacterium]|jgi:signal peptidase II
MNPRRVGLIAVVALAVFALDRVSKSIVASSLPLGGSVELAGPYVRITNVRNSGAAFGLLPERTTLLSILSVVAVVAILYYYRQLAARSPLIAATLGMQLGGAFGNLVDRLGQGYVVDFVDVGFDPGPRFWAFNVADSSIVVGILLVIVTLWWEERSQAHPTTSS